MNNSKFSFLTVLALSALTLSACGGKQSDTSANNDSTMVQQDSAATTSSNADFSDLAKKYGVSVSGKEGNYTYVDLGLKSGTKWATLNLGAYNPSEYGYYFAWGETKEKAPDAEGYALMVYKYAEMPENGSSEGDMYYSKYILFDLDEVKADKKSVLEAADDAATANWGSAWRMPTEREMRELLEGCTWTWTDNFNNMNMAGQIGTSKTNGNTIFLPAAGHMDETYSSDKPNAVDSETNGYYWTSSLQNKEGFDDPFCLNLKKSGIDVESDSHRFIGYSVRAVLNK